MIGTSHQKAPVGAGRWSQRWAVPAVCLGLAAITFAVFGQTLTHEFIDYDDNEYVYGNPVVARGLTLKGLVWVFTHADLYFYDPLSALSHMLDCQLYGLHPGGHHLTNVLLHTATVIALFLVLRQMTGALWRSAFVAAVFAIHPLRVESVAWVAERKDVLSGLFFMLTLGAYVRYARHPWSLARYLMVAVLFVLALLSKQSVATLPFVLLLLDCWPLHRFEQPQKFSGLILEKIPLLALAAGVSVISTMTLVAGGNMIAPVARISMPSRVGNVLVSYAVYLRQMVWPEGLAVPYLHPHNGLPPWEVALAGTLLAVLSAVAWGERRKRPWLLIGWLWYLGMLAPLICFAQMRPFAHPDRYTYLPQIGIYLAVTWLVAEWGAKRPAGRVVMGGLMTTVIALLMVCAWQQTAYWKNCETLWTHTVACYPDNEMAHFNLGNAFLQKGRMEEAIAQYQKAAQINPDYAEAHYNLGTALLQKGSVDEAIVHFQKTLQIKPGFVKTHYNLGTALLQKGRADEAIVHFQKALLINPDDADAHNNLGFALLQKRRVDEAISHCRQAVQLRPDFAEAHNNLGTALLQNGNVDEAITQFQQALQIKPSFVEARNDLGNAFMHKGRVDEAIACYQKALQIKPDFAEARNNLGLALLQKGNVREEIAYFQEALQLEPANATAQNNLAWLLATSAEASLRDGNKAVKLAQEANARTGGEDLTILHTLAAAFAEAGRFPEAVATAQRALQLAQAQSNTNLAGQLQSELKFYQAGTPFHIPEQSH
jgi:protein O-mannosyl-transferase